MKLKQSKFQVNFELKNVSSPACTRPTSEQVYNETLDVQNIIIWLKNKSAQLGKS
jgi:hypothetical protein